MHQSCRVPVYAIGELFNPWQYVQPDSGQLASDAAAYLYAHTGTGIFSHRKGLSFALGGQIAGYVAVLDNVIGTLKATAVGRHVTDVVSLRLLQTDYILHLNVYIGNLS